MINSTPAAVLYGAALGAMVGWATRLALGRGLKAPEAVFYSVFVGGIFIRLFVLVAAVCLLRHEKYIIIIAFAVSQILVQTIFEAFPLKYNGIKRNS
ncbi:MAG TPA: hypothetical protein DCS63_10960 [Elusimicrobia bacterium]|nr:hypothetical protein [Elusimicrobiota bacterium]